MKLNEIENLQQLLEEDIKNNNTLLSIAKIITENDMLPNNFEIEYEVNNNKEEEILKKQINISLFEEQLQINIIVTKQDFLEKQKFEFSISNGKLFFNKKENNDFLDMLLYTINLDEKIENFNFKNNNILNTELMSFLKDCGYSNIKEIPGWGVCCLNNFIFTTGLLVGVTKNGFEKRYCFENYQEALDSINNLDENKKQPDGPWIKVKGIGVDDLNPLLFNKETNNKKFKK